MYICEKNGRCVDCPITNSNEEPCEYMIEVAPVVHAKWIWKDFMYNGVYSLCCSECLETEGARETATYCSNCGAIMDAE